MSNRADGFTVIDIGKGIADDWMMRWYLTISPIHPDELRRSITLTADNWYNALDKGLTEHGLGRAGFSTLCCRRDPQNRCVISCALTQRRYTLEPYTVVPMDEMDAAASPEDAMSTHTVFSSTDDAPSTPDGYAYRERLIHLGRPIARATARRLLLHHFDAVKALPDPEGAPFFVSIQLFDHHFEMCPLRPPVAALTARTWETSTPAIVFPLSGEEAVFFDKCSASQEKPSPARSGEIASRTGVPRDLIAAFEMMQTVYEETTREAAAARFLSVVTASIPADGAECILAVPKEDEARVTAVSGAVPDGRIGVRLPLSDGFLGFVAATGAVFNMADLGAPGAADGDIPPAHRLIAPMQFEGTLIGFVRLVNTNRTDAFTQTEADRLAYLAASFAELALRHLRDGCGVPGKKSLPLNRR